MALPSPAKTWQIASNQGPYTTAYTQGKNTLFPIKSLMVGFALSPWTVVRSCNGVDDPQNSDLWVDADDLVWSTGNHSWIVLKQPGILSNFQLCLDLSRPATVEMDVVVSEAAGFTGGTKSARPTATDEVYVRNNGKWGCQYDTRTQRIHMWHATDGSATRCLITSSDGGQAGFFDVCKPVQPISYWSNPWVMGWEGTDATASGTYTSHENLSYADFWYSNRERLFALSEMYGSKLVLDNLPLADALLPGAPFGISPIGLGSTVTGFRGGVKGVIPDMWFFSESNDMNLVPDDGSGQFVVWGEMLFPWDGTTPLRS